jgi:hypothetical protein
MHGLMTVNRLHRAIYGCSEELYLGQDTDKYVDTILVGVHMRLSVFLMQDIVADTSATS